MNVNKITEPDLVKFVSAWRNASETEAKSFDYFNELHGIIEGKGGDWSQHLQDVIYAGKDESYNVLKSAEAAARKTAEHLTAEMVPQYPYLTNFQVRRWDTSSDSIRAQVLDLWRDAVVDSLRLDFKTETDAVNAERKGYPPGDSLKTVPFGSLVIFYSGFARNVMEVVKRSPSGRITSLKCPMSGEIFKVQSDGAKHHPLSFCIVPKDRAEYILDLSRRWETALKANGIERKGEGDE